MKPERLTALLESLQVLPEVEGELRAMLEATLPGGVPGPPRPEPTGGPALPARYEDRGLLGRGGMGEVRRVWDEVLQREVALKVVRADLVQGGDTPVRFVAEARATAALSHPGIVPVYDLGHLADGRPYFTMQIVRGETLREWIARHHAERGDRRLGFRRLVDIVERVCGAVAYAHARGLVHRDLKPANLLVGEHGEVRVVDWGLFRADPAWDGPPALVAAVAGTPAYMAPEQARGEVDRIDARSDVWALGIVLWEIAAGRTPLDGVPMRQILERVARGEVPGPPPASPPLPEELVDLVGACLRAEPAHRPAHAGEVGAALRRWLDGESRRDRARQALHEAVAAADRVEPLRRRAEAARQRADLLLASAEPWEPDVTRESWWNADDEATALERAWREADRSVDQALEAALAHDPDDPDANALAALRSRAAHARAESAGDADAAASAEHRLARHARQLPDGHPERARALRWLQGDGAVTLLSDPPGAVVRLWRYDHVRRRSVAVPERELGVTPLRGVPMARGAWLLTLEHPERLPVRYPIHVERGGHWTGVPPRESEPLPIRLPRPGELGPDDCYVPAGWARLGGDADAPSGLPALRVWVDAFVMRRFVVTNTEYLAFVNDLVARGRREEAERWAPRDRGASPTTWGHVLYARDGERFALGADADGDQWLADWPVVMIDHVAAWAFARWEAARTGQPWRLPGELEWEKAARGVDGRVFPWGDFADPSWCSNRLAFRGAPRMEVVGTRPIDESVYGVRGLAGNVVEWTADRFSAAGATGDGERVGVPDGSADDEAAWAERTATHRIVGRGGSRGHDLRGARSAFRSGVDPWARSSNVGFRLARPW